MSLWGRIFDKKIKVNWDTIHEDDIARWADELDSQTVDEVFDVLYDIIDRNNKRKAIVKCIVQLAQAGSQLGIKIVK